MPLAQGQVIACYPVVRSIGAGGMGLPTTGAAVWPLYPGEMSSPTMTPGTDDEVYAPETESPVLPAPTSAPRAPWPTW